ncbi:MAG TPA: 23S rRNA (guanosine(2251)-2'-O)-methyltransferase RlmB [Candidatus Limnocylindrales bacterium]|nr:23S rRNA (guanosine(2251)-2'-O)-methyltransferase RlmB [Candidatus Limnocylindrales bacterium]
MADRPRRDRDDNRPPDGSRGRRGPGPGQGGRGRPPDRQNRPPSHGGPRRDGGGRPPQGGRQGFGWRSDGGADRPRHDRDHAGWDRPRDRPPDRPYDRDRPPRPDDRDRPPRPRPEYRDRPREPGVPPGPRRPYADRRPWERDRQPYPSRPPRPRFEPAAPPIEPLQESQELIAGRRPVEEAFVAGRDAQRLLVTPQRRHALEQVVLHATRLRIPIEEVEGGSLTALAGFDGHQGVALVVGQRRFASVDEILARAIERNEPPFILVLDSLEDPQNVGTLLRSAEAAGVHGVIFPTRRQAPLTPSAVKASAGAVEHLLLAPVEDLPGALADLHARGLRIAGADEGAPLTARQADLRGPLAIVIGSEGHGLGPAVRRRADTFMRIPMRGAIGSLNAAVAGSILLFEAVAQRDPGGDGAPPRSAPEPVRPELALGAPEAVDPVPDPTPERPAADIESSADPSSEEDELLPGGPPAEAAP